MASMRPRHKAAEYAVHDGRRGHRLPRASMRPRHKAAEYALLGGRCYPTPDLLQ